MDWSSYLWGLASGIAILIFSGFFKEIGKDSWQYLKSKINPQEPDPIKIDGKFENALPTPSNRAWIRDTKLFGYEAKGYTYFPHPKNNAKCYREMGGGSNKVIEYLMVKPSEE